MISLWKLGDITYLSRWYHFKSYVISPSFSKWYHLVWTAKWYHLEYEVISHWKLGDITWDHSDITLKIRWHHLAFNVISLNSKWYHLQPRWYHILLINSKTAPHRFVKTYCKYIDLKLYHQMLFSTIHYYIDMSVNLLWFLTISQKLTLCIIFCPKG